MLSQVFNGMSLGDLQDFITEQEKLAIKLEPESGGSPVVGVSGGYLDDHYSEKQSQEHGKNTVGDTS